MAEWAVKRFWTSATVEETDGGFRILLDKRSIKTPAKAQVIAPTRALADKIAQEWDAQGEMVDPMTMPFTRMTNSAIDKVTTQFDEVVEHLASYAETDHLCYRAEGPEDLVARQKAAWILSSLGCSKSSRAVEHRQWDCLSINQRAFQICVIRSSYCHHLA